MTSPAPIRSSLERVLGPDAVRDDPETTTSHAVDGVLPRAVAFPASTDAVAEAVRLCRRERLAVIPWGSGSKMAAGFPPERFDLALSTERLRRIVDMDTANLTVTVEAGVRFKTVQAALAGKENRCYLPLEDPVTLSQEEICSDRENRGCFIPMTPPHSRTATLGGIVAANSSGPTRLLHGLPRDLVLGVRHVTPTGEVVGMGGKTVKNVSGYDVSKLMIGSRGSLGVLCEITLRLLPLPERTATALFSFDRDESACRFVDRVLETPLLPAALELLNPRASDLLIPEEMEPPGHGSWGVALALEGVDEAVTRMRKAFEEMGGSEGARSRLGLEGEAHARFWERHGHLEETLAEACPNLVTIRPVYPLSRYRDLAAQLDTLDAVGVLQAGSGTARVHILPPSGGDEVAAGVRTAATRLLDACAQMGGGLSVERAAPVWKAGLPVWGPEPHALALMKRIKERMDPDRLFSPGRFVDGI